MKRETLPRVQGCTRLWPWPPRILPARHVVHRMLKRRLFLSVLASYNVAQRYPAGLAVGVGTLGELRARVAAGEGLVRPRAGAYNRSHFRSFFPLNLNPPKQPKLTVDVSRGAQVQLKRERCVPEGPQVEL
jgi:hypothetical protein